MRFEDKPLAFITKADIDAIREAGRPFGKVGCNRLLARLRHFWNWCIVEGYATSTPFKRGTETVVKLKHRARDGWNRANVIACWQRQIRTCVR